MTISSTSSGPSSTGSASLIASSPPSLQSLPRRPINPPPYRLDFEPVATLPYSNGRHANKAANLHQELPLVTETAQETIFISEEPAISTTPMSQSVDFSDNLSNQEPRIVKGVVYMLHGWAQNVHVFSNRARKLTKRLNKAGYKVVFLQGPHRLPPVEATSTGGIAVTPSHEKNLICKTGAYITDNSTFSREFAYAWFLYDEDEGQSASSTSEALVLKPSPNGDFKGMDASLSFLKNELQADRTEYLLQTRTDHRDDVVPPFFLLGFSQGAVLVHKVATLACASGDTRNFDGSNQKFEEHWKDVQKCILVSGFSFTTSIRRDVRKHNDEEAPHRPGSLENDRRITSRMPSFHVVGRKDSRVSPSLTMELYDMEPCFCGREEHAADKILWEHDRGHVLPQDRNFCERLIEFLSGT